ncbi:MAG: ArnT family glycosyltransferase [Pirellulales bacterium]
MLAPAQHPLDEPLAALDVRPVRPWREWEFWLVVLFVLGVYFTRLTDLTIRGEESRWARVAHEMLASGDWIVPRQQGQPFPDRPPLNSWAMMAASRVTGALDLTAIRLPSALATLLTALIVYCFGRSYLTAAGSFAAASAFATTGQVLHLGRVAESDSLLTLFLTAACCGWHYAYYWRRDPRLAWLCGFALAALAALAKGPQGPVYFVAATGVYLALRRDGAFWFNRWHAAGLALFAALIGLWQVPFALAVEPALAWRVWAEEGNLAGRFAVTDLSRAIAHWATFPCEVFASMLPWSCMVPALASPWMRRNVGHARPMWQFGLTLAAVAVPTCWLPLESRARYLMVLCPWLALCVGLLIERSWQARQVGWFPRSWDNFVLTGATLILAAPVALASLSVWGANHRDGFDAALPVLSATFLVGYVVAAVAAAALALHARRRRGAWRIGGGMLALAGFLGLTYNVVVVEFQRCTSNDAAPHVASIRSLIPPGERLVSYGHVHHLFAYYYEQPIAFAPLADHGAPADDSSTYFCYSVDPGFDTPVIPFAWEPVAEISCDRARTDNPRAKVIVGRRISQVARTDNSRPTPADESPRPVIIDTATRPASFESPVIRR